MLCLDRSVVSETALRDCNDTCAAGKAIRKELRSFFVLLRGLFMAVMMGRSVGRLSWANEGFGDVHVALFDRYIVR